MAANRENPMGGGSGYRKGRFYRMGEFSHDHRWKVIGVAVLVMVSLGSLLAGGADFGETFNGKDMESFEAQDVVSNAFAENESEADHSQSGAREFLVIYTHASGNASDPDFQAAVEASIASFADRSHIENISSPWNTPADVSPWHISDDGSHVRVKVTLDPDEDPKAAYRGIRDHVECGDTQCWQTEGIASDVTFDDRMVQDLVDAEMLSAPLTLIILVIVFSSIVAAVLPLLISVPTVICGIGIIYFLSHQMDVNNYAMNIISLIGIGVSIDYALFIVNRFREELANGKATREALAITSATAGKAVFFSGITVAIGLSGMLFFEGTGLPSMGIGGSLAVGLAVFFSTTFLMAVLSLLGENVNRLRVPFGMKQEVSPDGAWARLAEMVMKHPWATLIPILILLLGAGAPFLEVNLGLGGMKLLAPDEEARVGYEVQAEEWSDAGSASIFIVFEFEDDVRFENATIDSIHAFATTVLAHEDVAGVAGIHFPDPSMNASQVKELWAAPAEYRPAAVNDLAEATSSPEMAMLVITYIPEPGSPASHELVEEIRLLEDDVAFSGKVGGWAAVSVDIIDEIQEKTPIAVAYILICTGVLVFIQVRSILIPLKAMVMNVLSLTASFGMLVYVFQQGHGFEELLNFTPLPVDPTTPVIMFCIVFGLSMDYEVLMLSRIHEAWLETGDNTKAVSQGLQQTGRLITGAAAVMVVVFGSFVIAKVQIIKAIGLGLALAIAIDATLVRALVVPATMRLMGKTNWWSPAWLDRIFPTEQPQVDTDANEAE